MVAVPEEAGSVWDLTTDARGSSEGYQESQLSSICVEFGHCRDFKIQRRDGNKNVD